MRNLVFAAALASVVMMAPRPAHACGGCFHDPSQNPTVVTDHRMILSVSQQQTTLYDQVQYSGAPESFAWVLPISGVATVGLSSDLVFDVLDATTHTAVFAPPTGCPPPPQNCFFGSDGSTSIDASAGGVQVLKNEVVGPYETVQLASSDPQALNTWLTTHGFAVPSDIQPIIDAYVALGLDFLAMKLVPGASVQAMRPVRVTTLGASPILPLRMVAAGTGSSVGLTLWVVGEGRYEPENFAWFRIQDSEIVWDWPTSSSNYTSLRAQKEKIANNATWEIESSLDISTSNIDMLVTNGGSQFGYGYDPSEDYPSTVATDGGDAGDAGDAGGESSAQLRDDDLSTLFAGAGSSVRITRMRADLSRTALSQDLTLQASADQSVLAANRYPTHTSGAPTCPIYGSCPIDPDGDGGPNAMVTGGCAMTSQDDGPGTLGTFGALMAMVAYGLARRRKR